MSDKDSVYSNEPQFEILGTPEKNVLDRYGESYENLLEILAVVIIFSPISSICGTVLSRVTAYGVAAISRLINIIGLLCKRAL